MDNEVIWTLSINDNPQFDCKIDGCCDWHMNPNYKEGDKQYCEIGKENNM